MKKSEFKQLIRECIEEVSQEQLVDKSKSFDDFVLSVFYTYPKPRQVATRKSEFSKYGLYNAGRRELDSKVVNAITKMYKKGYLSLDPSAQLGIGQIFKSTNPFLPNTMPLDNGDHYSNRFMHFNINPSGMNYIEGLGKTLDTLAGGADLTGGQTGF